MADRKVLFTMRIAGGGFEDLYPYEIFLEEGFSFIYKARLTLLSDVLHDSEALLDILDLGISLTISQVLRDAVTLRKRYFHGIITAAAVEGVFSSGSQNCYRYTMTIESPLTRLRYNRHNASYYRKSPVDAVEAILTNNEISARFPESYIKRNEYSSRLMFNQSGVSDLEFIGNILFTYGISFTNIHPPVAEDAVATADMVFSAGESFPAPTLEYSDNREIPELALFDFIQADEGQNIWKMDAFRMENSIGVDGIEVTAVYPEFNYGNEDWKVVSEQRKDTTPARMITYNRLFTGYERGTAAEEIDADVQRILAARFRGFELAKAKWTGKAANLLLMPGALFELAYLFGPNDDNPITAMVTTAQTHTRAVWPEHLAVKTEDFPGETVETAFTCINYASGVERRFCGTLFQ
jgi:uncharacterized protein involved in type VI secretion and phage assembly